MPEFVECQFCGSNKWKTIRSQPVKNGRQRRQQCVNCTARMTTKEVMVGDQEMGPKTREKLGLPCR